MNKTALIALAFALVGCAAESPEVRRTSSDQVELAGLLPADAVLVGVAITPEGRRYVLDQRSGLYELSDGSARLVVNTKLQTSLDLTDVVALDSDRFALTAEGDGFLLSLTTTQLSSYFCYLPASPPSGNEAGASGAPGPISISQTLRQAGVDVSQRTESVAFNAATRELFVQPRTTRLDTGAVAGSELFVFTEQGGQPTRVSSLPDGSFVAGGMVADPPSRLILGAGSRIFEATPDGQIELKRELDPAVNITGMARDPSGAIWYLDGAARRLVSMNDRF